MVVTKDSPHRRRSLAVPSHAQPSAVPRRRRAHSVAPRISLSPQAKARRLLVPRKSILKTCFTADDAQTESQPPQSSPEDADVTQSMEFTQDFRARIRDNASRKSFGRRVSFAEHAHVRVFQIPDKNHTSSTGSPQSSPSSASSEPDPEPEPQTNDENDYPNANFARRRRSSVRYSITSEDMDLTSVGPSGFIMDSQGAGSAIMDEEFDEEGVSDDMEVTQVIHGDIARKRSLSMGVSRRDTLPPSAILEMSDDAASDADLTQSSIADDSMVSDAPSDRSQAMEFTVPLNKSLRPPAHEDEVWLALRQATHSGDTPYEPENESLEEDYPIQSNNQEMHLDDAVQRLMRARESMSQTQDGDSTTNFAFPQAGNIQEDTVSSMDSMEDDYDGGNRTLNLSRVLSRTSVGGNSLNSRMSLGDGETSMDESEIYGNIVAASSTPRQSLAPSNTQPAITTSQQSVFAPPAVFHPPPQTMAQQSPALPTAKATVPQPFSFSQEPPASPSKNKSAPASAPTKPKPKPTFSAAFAPPVARPSPKKAAAKRAHEGSDIENVDADKPSPAKRQALAGKWLDAAGQKVTDAAASPSTTSTPRPRPLSPSKKSPFQSMTTQPAHQPAHQPPSVPRQPSGYMARRKSLAVGFSSNTNTTQPSPKRRAGRASVGSAPQDAWARFDKGAQITRAGKEKEDVQPEERIQEAPQRKVTLVSPARRSPSPQTPSTTVDVPSLGEPQEEDWPMDKTEQWREGIENGEYEDEDFPAISIAQFFDMTGIKFMDEIAAPRRSMHPSQQPTRQPRMPEDIPLSEYVVSTAVDIPQLELYTRVSRDLGAWMEKSKSVFLEAEEEAAKVTPELFVEYSRADEENQNALLHQLNFIKTNTRGLARSDWYDWKLKWVEGLNMTASKAFADLESDARKLEVIGAAADELIPVLEREYADIMEELEKEQAEVAEIEASDQEYLNELKVTIAEQNIEVEALKDEVTESREQLAWLKERLRETETQKQEVSAAIAKAERVLQIQKSSTRAEVFQLKDELEALEDLHMVRIIKVNAQFFEYIYDSTFRISIPCKNFMPIVQKITIGRLERLRRLHKDAFPMLSNLFLTTATEILSGETGLTVRDIIHKLGDYWTACAQLRSHLTLLNIKYPIEIQMAAPSPKSPSPGFKVRTTVMFPKAMGKAFIIFLFNTQTFSQWPVSIDALDCDAEVAYGTLERNAILKAVVDRLAQATSSDNYALLDSCIEAQSLYS